MRFFSSMGACLVLSSCAQTQFAVFGAKQVGREPAPVAQTPASGGTYKVGNPYVVNGVTYEPRENPVYNESGIASWYGNPFHGQRTANGDIYDMNAMTAAHQTLPMPSYVRVTNLENGRSVILTVNDRGPFVQGRIIDVSNKAAQLLGFVEKGTALTRVEAVSAPTENLIAARGAVPRTATTPAAVQIAAAPRPAVAVEALAPVTGVPVARQVPLNPLPRVVNAAMPPEVTLVGVPVVNRLYVQAGAFASYDSANNVRLALSSLGPVTISSVDVNGRQLYRVRLGPLDSVPRAESTLGMVIARGHTEARIVVE